MRRFALIALVPALLAAGPLFAADDAQEKDDICAPLDNASEQIKKLYERTPRKYACRFQYWDEFKAKPARDLFDTTAYAAYRQALEREDCDTAMGLLARAFVAAYPRAPDIEVGRRGPELKEALRAERPSDYERYRERYNHYDELQSHFITWQTSIVPQTYPEMAFCNAMRQLNAAQEEIAALKLDAPRYQDLYDALDHPSRQHPEAVKRRNGAIGRLFELSHRYRYAPATVALLELSQQGNALRFVPAYQYYLLNYLVAHGGVPAERVADMLEAAASKLLEAKRSELDEQARQGEYKEPLPIND